MNPNLTIVIIGGEAAGMSAAAKAKRSYPNATITVYEASDIISFGACGLPYFIGEEFTDPNHMTEFSVADFATKGISVHTRHRVLAVHPDKQQLDVQQPNGTTVTITYDRLLIATGAVATRPAIEGLDLPGVFGLRTLPEGLALQAALLDATCQNVVIIGGGYIGLEVAEALVHRGKTVRLLEHSAQLMPGALDADMAELLANHLTPHLALHCGETVQRITGDAHQVRTVHTTAGDYPADAVIVCTGVRPNTDFIAALPFERLDNGALVIDQAGRTSLPHIYAAGDCASVWHRVLQRPVYLPLATNANKLGRLVGDNLGCADPTLWPGALGSAALRCLGLEVARTGLTATEATQHGIPHRTVTITDKCHTNYCEGQAPLHCKLVYDPTTKRLLGGQLIGTKGAAHRIDALAVAIQAGLTTSELGWADLAYAPPFARPWDILNVAGNVAK